MQKYKLAIHSIETMGTLDGAGIRCVIFFQGCPLRCLYCHNPDTWGHNATGIEYDVYELLEKVLRNRFYFSRGGGVTFSGGEPLLQAANLVHLVECFINSNVNTLLDTSGCIYNNYVEEVIKKVDQIILDFKFPNEKDYFTYTKMHLSQFILFIEKCRDFNKKIKLRTVIVPGINDKEEYLDQYIEVIKQYDHILEWELLGFHTMGFDKYESLNIENPLKKYNALDSSTLEKLQIYVDSKMRYSK